VQTQEPGNRRSWQRRMMQSHDHERCYVSGRPEAFVWCSNGKSLLPRCRCWRRIGQETDAVSRLSPVTEGPTPRGEHKPRWMRDLGPLVCVRVSRKLGRWSYAVRGRSREHLTRHLGAPIVSLCYAAPLALRRASLYDGPQPARR
jgi:hypothetical protein